MANTHNGQDCRDANRASLSIIEVIGTLITPFAIGARGSAKNRRSCRHRSPERAALSCKSLFKPHGIQDAFAITGNIRRWVVDRLRHACCCPTPAQAKFNVVTRQFDYTPGHRMHGPTRSVDVDGMVCINGKWGNNAMDRVIKLPITAIIDNLTLFTCCQHSTNSLSPEYLAGLRFDTLQLATLRALA